MDVRDSSTSPLINPMAWTREADDAFHRLLGYSQEYLDYTHKFADGYRAHVQARQAQFPPWEWASSDSDLETDNVPPTPPESPKGDGPNLSVSAWERRIWTDRARGVESRETGFNDFDKWRAHVISEHQKALPASTPVHKPGERKKRCSAVATVSKR